MPIFITAYYGLFENNGMGSMDFIGLDNYKKLFFEDKHFIDSIFNSLKLAAASLFIQLPIAFILAAILARGVLFEQFYRTVYFLPVVISSMVIGQLWLMVFNGDHGLLNKLLEYIGLGQYAIGWTGDERTAFMTTVIPAVWQYIGYHMIIMYAGIKSIPTELYEAANIDGANSWQIATKITLPLLTPILKVCVTFALIGSLRSFDLVYIITRGGPFHASELPSTLMYANLFKKGLYGYGSAQAFFIVLECLIISLAVRAVFKKSEDVVSGI
jgi:raffinose/stachyose/melibiose transport system permease protein